MRAILTIVILVLICALIGWISFSRDEGRASMTIETHTIEEDTQEAVQEGHEVLREAGERIREEFHEEQREEALEEAIQESPPPEGARPPAR
ncbi:MAG: hypothetical protein KY476_13195 [Planctomycetes bacterium]|nr:hypothetical protein [Planctomycetota bacterium]